jgi:methionine synthase II (cobalamin-independent)
MTVSFLYNNLGPYNYYYYYFPGMSTKPHARPPFRAEQLGSLLRPKHLLDVKHRIDKGQKGLEKDLKSIEDSSIKEIVKEQLDLGFHAVSDGEYRRHMFW